SQMGFARSISQDGEVQECLKHLQRELFRIGSAIATSSGSRKAVPEITPEMVDALEAEVHRIEAMPGILGDWSLPGELPGAAALDVARTTCRRTERLAVHLWETERSGNPQILAYLNRLSDLLWLLGRLLELRAGLDSSLRPKDKGGARWSRAW
ncbi:MAG: ATP:cob(I)alamin adenosyltransferase, partial [Acidobacteria bacterium]|nr:ATP:cob(I)alamin adenosyltransferase [Acidobacteriota bacterium]